MGVKNKYHSDIYTCFQLKKKMAKVPEQMADEKRTYRKKIYVPFFFFLKKYNHLAIYIVHVMCCTVVYKH